MVVPHLADDTIDDCVIGDSLGSAIKMILFNFRGIEEWSKYSRGLLDLSKKDRLVVNTAIANMQAATRLIFSIFPNKARIEDVKQMINSKSLVHHMVLCEQVSLLRDEDLDEVTDLIDNYLKNKYE